MRSQNRLWALLGSSIFECRLTMSGWRLVETIHRGKLMVPSRSSDIEAVVRRCFSTIFCSRTWLYTIYMFLTYRHFKLWGPFVPCCPDKWCFTVTIVPLQSPVKVLSNGKCFGQNGGGLGKCGLSLSSEHLWILSADEFLPFCSRSFLI